MIYRKLNKILKLSIIIHIRYDKIQNLYSAKLKEYQTEL